MKDYSAKSSENLRVSRVTIPEQAVAGMRTQLRFTLDPPDGLEKYLGAWAHMLVASNDLIDVAQRLFGKAAAGARIDRHALAAAS